jgi:hypothetical protein
MFSPGQESLKRSVSQSGTSFPERVRLETDLRHLPARGKVRDEIAAA